MVKICASGCTCGWWQRKAGLRSLHLSPIGLSLNPSGDRAFPYLTDLVRFSVELGITYFDITACSPRYVELESHIGNSLRHSQASREEMKISVRIGLGTHWNLAEGHATPQRIVAGLKGTLRRTGLDHVDILYLHRPDPITPLEESMGAISSLMDQGIVLHVGLSSFSAVVLKDAVTMLKSSGKSLAFALAEYSLCERWPERSSLISAIHREGLGFVSAAPLAHGFLTNRTRRSCACSASSFLSRLASFAASRNRRIEEVAIAWVLSRPGVSSALLSSSSLNHLKLNRNAQKDFSLSSEDVEELELICASCGYS
ncbi:aldo/keto reductase [Streptomyces sp. NPDC096198]|uniref:aldo/keto reductase n=1 Tax=Streptomyces sp. NPDC096198 TaxID=3366080 RepID=UPI0038192E52